MMDSSRNLAVRVLFIAMSGLLAACGTVPTAPVQGGAPASDVAFAVVADALSLAGTPYRDGGVSPETGFDCSGLIYYVYGRQGVRLPRVAAAMASALQAVPEGDRRAGDLLFFNTRGSDFSHVALYVGDERFVHAPSERTRHG